jgi:two-component system sensor histidine kinase KdpD
VIQPISRLGLHSGQLRYSISVIRSLSAVGAILAATFLFSSLLDINANTAGFGYLICVLGVATAWGRVEAIICSLAAMLALNYYFLPPHGEFTIADPQNWVALVTFLATGLIASHLSDRAKTQAREALRRQRETEQLYTLSRAILLTDDEHSIGALAAQQIGQIFECQAVALYDSKSGETFSGGPQDIPGIEAKLKQVATVGSQIEEPAEELFVGAITLGGTPIGSLALKGIHVGDGARQALLNLVAVTLERMRTHEVANRAQITRQSEEFKSMLLDAIAHEFKTPLTSIKAAATSILSGHPGVQELATVIDEETDRLNRLVTDAVRMAEIEADKLRLDWSRVLPAELIERVLEPLTARIEGRDLRVELPPDLHSVNVDAELVALALRQLADNALKFSPPGTPIRIEAAVNGNLLTVRVHDEGPGIAVRDRERIFDKFYRRQAVRDQVPGSGLGLYVAREIMRAHGGNVWVEDEPGTCFALSIPYE